MSLSLESGHKPLLVLSESLDTSSSSTSTTTVASDDEDYVDTTTPVRRKEHYISPSSSCSSGCLSALEKQQPTIQQEQATPIIASGVEEQEREQQQERKQHRIALMQTSALSPSGSSTSSFQSSSCVQRRTASSSQQRKKDLSSNIEKNHHQHRNNNTSHTVAVVVGADTASPGLLSDDETSPLRQQHQQEYKEIIHGSDDDNTRGDAMFRSVTEQQPVQRQLISTFEAHTSYSHDELDDNNSTDGLYIDDDTEATGEERIIQVVDQVEDEWEELAYDQLVPLEVKLALERNIFGWSHLTSDILGHLLFTVGAFTITFLALWIVTPSKHTTQNSSFLLMLRWFVSIIAAWSSFRMVRRRRRIWFRAPYGSMKYKQDEARRRLEIAQIDNLTWIQRLKHQRTDKKIKQQLKKAEQNFVKAHLKQKTKLKNDSNNSNKVRFQHSSSYPFANQSSKQQQQQTLAVKDSNVLTEVLLSENEKEVNALTPAISGLSRSQRKLSFRTESVGVMQSVQHDQIMFLNGPIHKVPYSHGGGYGAAPFMLANPHWISILRYLMPDVYVEISRRVNAPPHKLIHWAENNPVVAAYATAQELEYGNHKNKSKPTTLEWDVFLDPHLVNRVEIVLQERQKFLLSVLPELPTVRPMERLPQHILNEPTVLTQSQRSVVLYYERELRKRAQLLVDQMLIAHGNLSQLSVELTGWFKHYNYSRVKRTRRTLGGGIYARQWVAVYAESLRLGVLDTNESHSNDEQSSSRRSHTKTKTPPATESIFTTTKTSLMEMTTSCCPNTSMKASIAIVRHITKLDDPVGLILDVKSRYLSNHVWACVVDILRESGVRVEGVGSFVMDEIRTLSKFTVQPVKELLFFHSAGDLQQACHKKLIRYGDHVFFNGGSLLWSPRYEHIPACTSIQNCLRPFDPEAFKTQYRIQAYALPSSNKSNKNNNNNKSGDGTSTANYQAISDNHYYNPNSMSAIATGLCSTIEDYKRRYKLKIGIYVQEFAIDNVAADMLVELVNSNPQIYDLGMAWGGINGITLRGIKPGRFTETTGYWNQRHLGCLWNPELWPPV